MSNYVLNRLWVHGFEKDISDFKFHIKFKYEDVSLIIDEPKKIVYTFKTIEEPPTEDISKLAQQYENIALGLEYLRKDGSGGDINFDEDQIITDEFDKYVMEEI